MIIEITRDCIQQCRVGRQVGVAEIVNRLDDAAPDQVEPHAIGEISAELTIAPCQPVRQVSERIVAIAGDRNGGHTAKGYFGLHDAFPVRGWMEPAFPAR